MSNGGTKKKQRVSSLARIPSHHDLEFPSSSSSSAAAAINNLSAFSALLRSVPGGFNDPHTADVVLHLRTANSSTSCAASSAVFLIDDDDEEEDRKESGAAAGADAVDLHHGHGSPGIKIYLHSEVLVLRSKYFSALLSDRWKQAKENEKGKRSGVDEAPRQFHRLALDDVGGEGGSMESCLKVLQLFYRDGEKQDEFAKDVIVTAAAALSLLPAALKLLFAECIRACIRFLEAVPWTEEEERAVLDLLPMLPREDSQELVSRLLPSRADSSVDMLRGLILAALHSHPNAAAVKAFVAKLLRDHSLRDPTSVSTVLCEAFVRSLRSVKESLEEYSSPNLRGDHDEIEALQRLNLHSAMVNGRHLLWLVERMVELGVADSAVKEWSNQASLAADLQRAFRDDAWRNIAPGLPALVLKCTCRLASAVVAGSVLADRMVRMKLVEDWLPVLIVCRETVSPIPSSQKLLYQDLEEIFLQIISTLPLSNAQELLQQCLSFSTRNFDECPHLVSAFNTWFRRATRPPFDQLGDP